MRLTVHNFRNYQDFSIHSDQQLVALCGKNGIGKTNLLEALSLFAPGRGLRYAPSARLAPHGTHTPIALLLGLPAESETRDGLADTVALSLGLTPLTDQTTGQTSWARQARLNGEPFPAQTHFSDYCRFVWVTPALDSLFNGSPGGRRRFLDRLVVTSDIHHGSRMVAFERALRSRRQLLEDSHSSHNYKWLDALEREIADLGFHIAQARCETVSLLNAHMEDSGLFPKALLSISGEVEALLARYDAIEVQKKYQALLYENRFKDRAAGRTLVGPQTSDLLVTHALKNLPSHLCSTGEQKALLLSIILAHTRGLKRLHSALYPQPCLIVLLDEIAAHLDSGRRAALFHTLAALGARVWMTGTDPFLFSELPQRSELFILEEGPLQPLLKAYSPVQEGV
jgi:DNA replication and repair protein RecF